MAYRFRGLGASALANAIFRQEGVMDASGRWVPGSLGYRLNNPGNLNYAGQPGCHATTFGNGLEAQCDSLDIGIQATERQLELDASRGLTLGERLNTWATGNKAAYVQNVSGWLGVDPETPLSELLGQSAGMVPYPADSGPVVGWESESGGEGSGLPPVALLGLGLAAVGLIYAVID